WLSPENFARVAAGPAVPVAVNVTGLPVRPAALAVRVLAPAVVPRVQVPTVAMPLEFVVCSAPVTLPPPDAGANVTLTPCTGLLLASRTITEGGVPPPDAMRRPTTIPAWLTRLPDASCSWITGCCWKAIPLCTVPDGCVAMASRVAVPAVPVAVKVTGLPASDPEAAVNVFDPAVGPSVHAVTAATPSAPVVTGLVGVTLPPPVPGANVTATPATGL